MDTIATRIVYFGDSISDRGAFYEVASRALTVPMPPASAGYAGWFSNGDVHSGVTPALLGIAAEHYAVGSGRALGVRTLADIVEQNLGGQTPPFDPVRPDAAPEDLAFDVSLGGQIDRFLADSAASGPVPGTAAVFSIGLNDYANFQPSDPDTAEEEAAALVAAVIARVLGAAAAVAAAGVDKIFLYTLPGASFFPSAASLTPERLALANLVIGAHNAGLAEGAELLRLGGVEAEVVDVHRIAEELVADSATFGLLPELIRAPKLLGQATDPTLILDANGEPAAVFPENPAVEGIDLDRLMFFDFLHPSAATHGVIGAFAAESLGSATRLLGDADDVVWCGKSDDFVLAGAGADRVNGNSGADALFAGRGADRVRAGAGDDIAVGGAGRDRVIAGAGADVVAGSAGNDVARGGRGRDLLVDGLGDDRLRAGRGDDALLYLEAALQGGENPDDGGVFYGGEGEDTLYLAVSAPLRALLQAEIVAGAARQRLAAIGVETRDVEHVAFLDPTDPATGLTSAARVEEADLWGIL